MRIEWACVLRRLLAGVALAAALGSLAPSSASAGEWLGCEALFGGYSWSGGPGNMRGCVIERTGTMLGVVNVYPYECPEDIYICYWG